MAAVVIIPARFGSTRFPAKILASVTGKPLVQHVVERAKRCTRVRDVIVATDDERIVAALRPFGTTAVMTSPAHQSGTDRIAEVARQMPEEIDIVVNVQGDEPEIEPDIIDRLVERLETSDDDMATAATPFPAGVKVDDPNLVKVVTGIGGRAIYFSRCPIPFQREKSETAPYFKHIGLYVYQRDFLLAYSSLPVGPLETAERLEQLRALENGYRIRVVETEYESLGVDTAEDLERVSKLFAASNLQGMGNG